MEWPFNPNSCRGVRVLVWLDVRECAFVRALWECAFVRALWQSGDARHPDQFFKRWFTAVKCGHEF